MEMAICGRKVSISTILFSILSCGEKVDQNNDRSARWWSFIPFQIIRGTSITQWRTHPRASHPQSQRTSLITNSFLTKHMIYSCLWSPSGLAQARLIWCNDFDVSIATVPAFHNDNFPFDLITGKLCILLNKALIEFETTINI